MNMQRDAPCVQLCERRVYQLVSQSSTLFSYKALKPNILFGFCCGIKKHMNPIVSQKDKTEPDPLQLHRIERTSRKTSKCTICEKLNNEICI